MLLKKPTKSSLRSISSVPGSVVCKNWCMVDQNFGVVRLPNVSGQVAGRISVIMMAIYLRSLERAVLQ